MTNTNSKQTRLENTCIQARVYIFIFYLCFNFHFFNLHSGGWKQGPRDTAAT
jgi:hypothetical protein